MLIGQQQQQQKKINENVTTNKTTIMNDVNCTYILGNFYNGNIKRNVWGVDWCI